ncbi:MAG TPA: regulatory protein GemA [Clostridiales bacterium]|nr:regulatory protein GemA [Clostridiales bacterium]
MSNVAINMITNEQKKALWGAAKSKGIDKDVLYSIIEDVSGKEHMTELTFLEAAKVLDRVNNKKHDSNQKRTDEGGNIATQAQRRKIYVLTGKLGWNDNDDRVNGFVKKVFKVERLEWLNKYQCNKLIEMLKKMVIEKGGSIDE